MPKHQYVKKKEQLKKEQSEKKDREQRLKSKKKSQDRNKKLILTGSIIALLVISGVIGFNTFVNRNKPGQWDNFAKCLTDEGAVMYGDMAGCTYTQHQAGMFGKSFKHIDYREFTEKPSVEITPTWYIEGEVLEGEQSFEALAEATGCSIY